VAIVKGYKEIALLLYNKGAKLEIQDVNADTVLHWAVAMENISLVKFCVEELGMNTEISNLVIYSLNLIVREYSIIVSMYSR